MIFPSAITIVEFGLDHFLLDRNIDAATVGLVTAVMRWHEESTRSALQRFNP
jgi:hypothetical protein